MKQNQPDEQRSRTFPVKENMSWQRLEWRIQRLGAAWLFIMVIAGACGLFSKGWLSHQTLISADGRLQVEYERFGLFDSDMTMTIRERQRGRGPLVITLSSQAMDNFQLQTLQPQPLRAVSSQHQMTLSWSRDSLQNGASVWLGLQPQKPGRYPVTISTPEGSRLQFTQWIYP
ncbi:hypothetical protein BL250_17025 [Erwinia sp. OLTSP20]|uniref:hypothetical protein n=1 Tax=unclassified Erwinia TaxID=2622719 RepID=UPI000C19E938|nr:MULTISPECIES: hypothetical protein [unclassified Erwinia]PIJ49031.1 hypothetical protein BV501_15100 [Erwinia sp. OAMSP11]PIJ75025.1 hypothetical protein BK416_02720 [Erwinia sp. OLSSP12]PIJ79716.1 hypothetical protein BLD47_13725 [Erwinia sp. OLCASP19]PIJ80501.1 hypothetical protein BLD46_15570 [Erwinia sp. OLMTSP26]PIJ82616.1 hypothetical protein BLD49_15465 [Erwinia sp. OLMDSP33]